MSICRKTRYIIVAVILVMMVQMQDIVQAKVKADKQPGIYSVELKSSTDTQLPAPSVQEENQPTVTMPTENQVNPSVILAPTGPQITLPTLNLPVVWSKVKKFERVAEGPIEVPFWQSPSAHTSIFGINKWKMSQGNFYSIAASNKMGPVSSELRGNRLLLTFHHAKASLKKSQTDYPEEEAISKIEVHSLKKVMSPTVQVAFVLKPATKDFVLRLDELGERILVEMITNAVIGVNLAQAGEEEVLTIESFQSVYPDLKRGPDNSLEIELPSTQSLVQNQEAFLTSKYIHRMAVTDRQKGKTKITVWLHENTEFVPEGQKIRFFAKKTRNLNYSYGILTLKKPENFNIEKVDYILDVHKRQASLAFPYQDYINGSYWIADSFITKIELMDERLHFTFPEVYELTIAEDRDHIYISAKKPKDIFNKVVFIDVGHGGDDPGAVRRVDLGNGYREYSEKEANLAVALLLREKLKQSPEIKAYFSRLTDENPSAYTRAKLANEVGADFFLSLHNNMTTVKNRKIEGTDIYYLAGRKKGNLATEDLAKVLLKNYAATTSFTNRLMHSAPHLYMVKYPQMPAVIVESGFMSDDGDLRKMFDPLEQEKTAEALYYSIKEAFGIYNSPKMVIK